VIKSGKWKKWPDDVISGFAQDPEEIARKKILTANTRESSEAGWRHTNWDLGRGLIAGVTMGKSSCRRMRRETLPVSICQCSYSYCTVLIVLSYRAGISRLFVVVCLDLVPYLRIRCLYPPRVSCLCPNMILAFRMKVEPLTYISQCETNVT